MTQYRETLSTNSHSEFIQTDGQIGPVKVSDQWITTIDPDFIDLCNLPRSEIRRMNNKLSNLIENKSARKRMMRKAEKQVDQVVAKAKADATAKVDLIVDAMFNKTTSEPLIRSDKGRAAA